MSIYSDVVFSAQASLPGQETTEHQQTPVAAKLNVRMLFVVHGWFYCSLRCSDADRDRS